MYRIEVDQKYYVQLRDEQSIQRTILVFITNHSQEIRPFNLRWFLGNKPEVSDCELYSTTSFCLKYTVKIEWTLSDEVPKELFHPSHRIYFLTKHFWSSISIWSSNLTLLADHQGPEVEHPWWSWHDFISSN